MVPIALAPIVWNFKVSFPIKPRVLIQWLNLIKRERLEPFSFFYLRQAGRNARWCQSAVGIGKVSLARILFLRSEAMMQPGGGELRAIMEANEA